jgi:hypothetical protein
VFTERRWERHHTNSWTSVVIQPDEDQYHGFAVTPEGERVEPHIASTSFGTAKSSAERDVLMRAPHTCHCPGWKEVPYSAA